MTISLPEKSTTSAVVDIVGPTGYHPLSPGKKERQMLGKE